MDSTPTNGTVMPDKGSAAELHGLVARAASDDVDPAERLEAFGLLVRYYQGMVYACAYVILGDFHLAEDVAQEGFLIAYRRLGDLRDPKAFAGWLRRIVVNKCRSELRRKGISAASLDTAPEPEAREPHPVEAIENGDAESQAVNALRTLPEDQRLVMALFYIDGYSQDGIAEFLEVPTSTVKARLFRSRRRLKREMVGGVEKIMKSAPLSGDFADLVVRKAASMTDLTEARKLMRYRGLHHSRDFESPGVAEKAGIFVVGEEGSVTAAGYFNEVEMSVGSTVLTCVRANETAYEAWGAPHPAFLSSYNAIFKTARQRDIPAAIVHGSQYDHAFCGFVPSFYYPVVLLPCRYARNIRTSAVIDNATAEQQQEAQRAWLLDPYAPKMHPPMSPGQIRVVRDGEDAAGYVRVNGGLLRSDTQAMTKKRLDYTLVTDVTVRTREAALAVIKMAAQLTEQTGRDTICMMQSHMTPITQTMLSLGGTYMLRRSCPMLSLGAQMIAVLDLVGLTRRMEREFHERLDGSSARDVKAALSIEMDHMTVGFAAEGGRVRIVCDPQPIHRRLPRWVVTRLYMGYYSGEEVLRMGPLPWDRSDGIVPDDLELDNSPLILPPPEAMLFRALFPKLWPVSWPDMDVWAWILGEDHPKYYFDSEITLSDEVKAKIEILRFPWLDR